MESRMCVSVCVFKRLEDCTLNMLVRRREYVAFRMFEPTNYLSKKILLPETFYPCREMNAIFSATTKVETN